MAHSVSRSQTNSTLKLAVAFQAGWLIIAGFYVLMGNTISLGLLIVNLPILLAPLAVELITRVRLPLALQLQFHILVTATSLLGSIIGFYSSVPNWDTYAHLYSGVLMAWLGFFVVRQAEDQMKKQFPMWFAILGAIAIATMIAAAWEIYEFMSDLLINTNMQIGGLKDTMIDMIAASIGSFIAIVFSKLFKIPSSLLPKSLR